MNKLSLRKENLSELTSDQLRNVAGALPAGGSEDCTVNVSDNSCVCGFDFKGLHCNLNVSDGSCVCGTA